MKIAYRLKIQLTVGYTITVVATVVTVHRCTSALRSTWPGLCWAIYTMPNMPLQLYLTASHLTVGYTLVSMPLQIYLTASVFALSLHSCPLHPTHPP